MEFYEYKTFMPYYLEFRYENDVWWIEIRIIIMIMVILVWNYTVNNLKLSLYDKLALQCFFTDITRKIIWRKCVKSIERCKNIKYSYMLAMLPLHDYSASGKENHWDLVHCVLECGWDKVGLTTRAGLGWGSGLNMQDYIAQLSSCDCRSQFQVLEKLEIWLSLWSSSPTLPTCPSSQVIFWIKFKLDSNRILRQPTSAQDTPYLKISAFKLFFLPGNVST